MYLLQGEGYSQLPKYKLGAILTIRRGPKLYNQTGMLSFDYHLFDARVYVCVYKYTHDSHDCV